MFLEVFQPRSSRVFYTDSHWQHLKSSSVTVSKPRVLPKGPSSAPCEVQVFEDTMQRSPEVSSDGDEAWSTPGWSVHPSHLCHTQHPLMKSFAYAAHSFQEKWKEETTASCLGLACVSPQSQLCVAFPEVLFPPSHFVAMKQRGCRVPEAGTATPEQTTPNPRAHPAPASRNLRILRGTHNIPRVTDPGDAVSFAACWLNRGFEMLQLQRTQRGL
ncbi:hypothetical protein HJG60_009216 [Phyllostomus discolor]|uniref:Uncharacterized protein n=1 Tax=Phyllostomus discolor TaxID=89673 RepID=A0A833YK20_9CHIR|nr:hypothetical protein HJG60_009216 [Phyllostomus discolor]